MKRKLLIIGLVLVGLVASVKIWLNIEVRKVQWAIELAGGMNALVSNRVNPTPERERVYLKTIRIGVDADLTKGIKELVLCTEDSEECTIQLFTMLNVASFDSVAFSKVEKILHDYRKTSSTKVADCEARYEISQIMSASRHALSMPSDEAKIYARKALETIQKNGGLHYSLNTLNCRIYFFENPAIAKAYLARLAFLMSVEKGNISPGWVYLLSVPGVKSLLDNGVLE